jgi:hypothetical protein
VGQELRPERRDWWRPPESNVEETVRGSLAALKRKAKPEQNPQVGTKRKATRFRAVSIATSVLAVLAATLIYATPASAAWDGFSGGEYSALYFTNSSTTICAEVHWDIETHDNNGDWHYSYGMKFVPPTFSWTPVPIYLDSGYGSAANSPNRRVTGSYYSYAFGSGC